MTTTIVVASIEVSPVKSSRPSVSSCTLPLCSISPRAIQSSSFLPPGAIVFDRALASLGNLLQQGLLFLFQLRGPYPLFLVILDGAGVKGDQCILGGFAQIRVFSGYFVILIKFSGIIKNHTGGLIHEIVRQVCPGNQPGP